MRARYIEPARWVVWMLNRMAYKESTGAAKPTLLAKIAFAFIAPLCLFLKTWYRDRARMMMLAACSPNKKNIQIFLDYWYGAGNVTINETNYITGMWQGEPVSALYCWGDSSTSPILYGLLGTDRTSGIIINYKSSVDIDRLSADLRTLIPFWVNYSLKQS